MAVVGNGTTLVAGGELNDQRANTAGFEVDLNLHLGVGARLAAHDKEVGKAYLNLVSTASQDLGEQVMEARAVESPAAVVDKVIQWHQGIEQGEEGVGIGHGRLPS
jgi:hypothetical protein